MRRLLAVTILLSAPLRAQSTSRVGHYERPFQYEVAAGSDFVRSSDQCCGDGPMYMASAGARWDPNGRGAFSLGVLGFRRNTLFVTPYSQTPDTVRTNERMLALTASFDTFLRLWGDLGVSAGVGGAFAPYAYGKRTESSPGGIYSANTASTSTAYLWSAAVGIRYRWLSIEQRAFWIYGADQTILGARDIRPVTIGVRF